MAPLNGRAQVEAKASSDRWPEGLHDGARQLLGRAQAIAMALVRKVRRGGIALGPHGKCDDRRSSDEGPGRAFHWPEVLFVGRAPYGSPTGSAMQSTPTSCNSSLGSSSATATRAGDPRDRRADGLSVGIEGWRNGGLASFAADRSARGRGERALGGREEEEWLRLRGLRGRVRLGGRRVRDRDGSSSP